LGQQTKKQQDKIYIWRKWNFTLVLDTQKY
jgi:hypothetical protein